MDDRSSSRRPQRQGSATRSQRQQPPVRPQRGGRGMHMDMDVLNGRLAIFFVAFCVFALILAIRLFGLMVIDAQANLNRDSSREVTVDVQPRRGTTTAMAQSSQPPLMLTTYSAIPIWLVPTK